MNKFSVFLPRTTHSCFSMNDLMAIGLYKVKRKRIRPWRYFYHRLRQYSSCNVVYP